MTDEATLRQAVLDAPDDDAPRLAYAQWCDGQGDADAAARAELIRTQIDLVHTDPEVLRTGAAFGRQDRVAQLITRYGAQWTGPIAGWIDGYQLVRGFVGLVRLSARAWLDHGAQILAAAPVQHVDLTAVRDVDEALFDSPLLAPLRSLGMDRCGLYDLHVQLLAASPHVQALRWLSVADNHLTLAAAEAIAASPHLRQLRYAEFRFNPSDPAEQVGYDGGVAVWCEMPADAQTLEAKFGPLAWLRREHVPDRFGA